MAALRAEESAVAPLRPPRFQKFPSPAARRRVSSGPFQRRFPMPKRNRHPPVLIIGAGPITRTGLAIRLFRNQACKAPGGGLLVILVNSNRPRS